MNKSKAFHQRKHVQRVERHSAKRRAATKSQAQKRYSTPRSQREQVPMLRLPSLRAMTATPLAALVGATKRIKFEAARFRHTRQVEVQS